MQGMLNAVVIGIHLFAALFLIVFVLLHSGKGGGLWRGWRHSPAG